ncbi:hypothetical protein BpHYR1_045897 [Brachionus plicatilis]|uniref:Uncharacterized protein n=1 Tax=Brachionus plicatilis TaxID=10195 RepID=A0A3M7S789_BRAPC|nr:hypothetical protein BpHYR1_045897 [Brachionus plicatilis]
MYQQEEVSNSSRRKIFRIAIPIRTKMHTTKATFFTSLYQFLDKLPTKITNINVKDALAWAI